MKDPSSEDVGTAAGEAQASPEDPMTHAQGLGGAPQAPDGARIGLGEIPYDEAGLRQDRDGRHHGADGDTQDDGETPLI